jgi:hypothetical protein
MAHISTIPTKAAVDRAWDRYTILHLAIQHDPQTRDDRAAQIALDRAHERFCNLYNDWSGR